MLPGAGDAPTGSNTKFLEVLASKAAFTALRRTGLFIASCWGEEEEEEEVEDALRMGETSPPLQFTMLRE